MFLASSPLQWRNVCQNLHPPIQKFMGQVMSTLRKNTLCLRFLKLTEPLELETPDIRTWMVFQTCQVSKCVLVCRNRPLDCICKEINQFCVSNSSSFQTQGISIHRFGLATTYFVDCLIRPSPHNKLSFLATKHPTCLSKVAPWSALATCAAFHGKNQCFLVWPI